METGKTVVGVEVFDNYYSWRVASQERHCIQCNLLHYATVLWLLSTLFMVENVGPRLGVDDSGGVICRLICTA